MKKLVVMLAAILAVAFVAPAFAADNLELSGQFRVRGWDINDAWDNKPAVLDRDDKSYFDQRMRVQAKIKASDNAYVVIRTDVAEGTWGSDFVDSGNNDSWYRSGAGTNATIQIDRAYGYYGQDNWGVTLGLQYVGLGILEVVDGQYTGMKLDLKFDAVNPTFFYGKLDENGPTNDDGANDDADLFALNLNFNVAGFDTNVFGGYVTEDLKAKRTNPWIDSAATNLDVVIEDAWAFAIYTAGKIGIVNLVGELAFLGGEIEGTDADLEGAQFYLKGDADVTDAVNIGAEFLWAAGDDDDVQITDLNSDAGDFTIADTNAPCATDVVVVNRSPFDFTGLGAGVVGGSLFGSYKAMDKLTVGAKVAYLTTEEDVDEIDHLASYSIWAGYDLGSNTSLVLLYNIADWDSDISEVDDSVNTLYARFMINF